MSGASVDTLAERLDNAWRTNQPIPPISESDGVTSPETAYAIQASWARMRLARGERIIGRKIGLTSEAIQKQLGVSEPDYGALWESSYYPAVDGSVSIPAGAFLQPRIEGEIAFLIGRSLRGPGLTEQDVLAATDACALGIEIVASRIADWRITLTDTIADNASYGGFTLGPWDTALLDADLATLAMTIDQDGELAAEGVGAAALGHPARSTAWLVNKLAEFGEGLAPGDIVISGGITRMLPVLPGRQFVFSLTSQPRVTISFT